jgi:hypothetical protein
MEVPQDESPGIADSVRPVAKGSEDDPYQVEHTYKYKKLATR